MISTEKDSVSILMLITSFYPAPMGGSERQAFQLAKSLKAKGCDVFIMAFGDAGQKQDEFVEGLRVFRIRPIISRKPTETPLKHAPVQIEYNKNERRNFEVPGRKSLFSFVQYFYFYFNVLWLIKSKRLPIHIIYVPMMEWTAFIASLLGRTLNKNVIIKDSTMNGITNLNRYPFGERMKRTIISNCHFVAMSTAINDNYLRAGIRKEKIYIVPNGIQLPALPVRHNVEKNKFIFVGNLYQQPAKGVDILLKSWKLVVNQIPDAYLTIIGDGHNTAYDEYTSALGIASNVHFAGKQLDFKDRLLKSLAFILPSRREGMSNALLEAMSFGVPCIATDISGSQDLITHNQNGLLIPVEDEVALAEAVIYFYRNPAIAEKMGAKGRQTIEEGYTIEQVSERYYQLFKSLTKR
jgi:glycosyltransferase involved in cell wall biosynthesis